VTKSRGERTTRGGAGEGGGGGGGGGFTEIAPGKEGSGRAGKREAAWEGGGVEVRDMRGLGSHSVVDTGVGRRADGEEKEEGGGGRGDLYCKRHRKAGECLHIYMEMYMGVYIHTYMLIYICMCKWVRVC